MSYTPIDKIPNSLELEKNILGLILLDGRNYHEVKDILLPKHFSIIQHVTLYQAIQDVYVKDKSISPMVLLDHLQSNDLMQEIGGEEAYVGLQTVFDKTDDLSVMANSILRKYQRRLIQMKSVELHSKLREDLPETEHDIDKLISEMVEINFASYKDTLEDIASIYKKTMSELMSQPEPQIKTGFIELDSIIGGFRRKNLIVLAARPAMGKTMLALNMAIHQSKSSYRVAFISLEMSKKELVLRAMTSLTLIPYRNIFELNMNTEDYKKLGECSEQLKLMDIRITETSLNIKDIRRLLVRAKHENKIDIVYIDYLQLISGVKYSDNRNLEVGSITRDLKLLSKELDISIVLLSQLNRGLENRPDKHPIASDLRDSGSIEQDADMILFIYRDIVYNRDADPNETEILINKNRNGESHKIAKMKFDGKSMNFLNDKHVYKGVEYEDYTDVSRRTEEKS
jgi:replicative DNA helicase